VKQEPTSTSQMPEDYPMKHELSFNTTLPPVATLEFDLPLRDSISIVPPVSMPFNSFQDGEDYTSNSSYSLAIDQPFVPCPTPYPSANFNTGIPTAPSGGGGGGGRARHSSLATLLPPIDAQPQGNVFAPSLAPAPGVSTPKKRGRKPKTTVIQQAVVSFDALAAVQAVSASSPLGEALSPETDRPPSPAPISPDSMSSGTSRMVKTARGYKLESEGPAVDEHRWRKYGQKAVKYSPYPRHYYRCSVEGCNAKKIIELFLGQNGKEWTRTQYNGTHVHNSSGQPTNEFSQ